MECGWPPESSATSRKRVTSPRAAKTGAEALSSALSPFGGIAGKRRELNLPALGVLFQHAGPPRQRESVEAGFHHGHQRAALDLRQAELHLRHGLGGGIFI